VTKDSERRQEPECGVPGLNRFVEDFAAGLVAADAKRPVAINHRTKHPFRPGIGPHAEGATVRLVAGEMRAADPARYAELAFNVPYLNKPQWKCDLAIGAERDRLFVEVKMLRLVGDNGKPNDNMLMHILSPYPEHRSAVTDCEKLLWSGFEGRKAILIFGYAYPGWLLEPAISAFEVVAGRAIKLGPRASSNFEDLCHPVHREGSVYAWELAV